MDRSPEFYRRVARLALDLEAVRVGLCLLLMAVLWIVSLPWELVVILPLLTYAGLRLLGPARESTPSAIDRPRPPLDEHEAFKTCQRLRAEIAILGQQVGDDENARWIRTVDDRFGQILAVIAEDEKYSMSVPLLDLVGTTHDLLSRYVKNVRRHLDDAYVHARVRQNLATIDRSCNRLWLQVNRDAVIDLEAMIETINATLKELDTPMEQPPPLIAQPAAPDPPDIEPADEDPLDDGPTEEWEEGPLPAPAKAVEPRALPGGSIAIPSPNGAGPETSLTPRELEVLCLIADGHSNRQISNNLFISELTTTTHVTNILGKLGVPSRTAAAA
jgi:DNA-binding CsgD family transcriptional regulator